MRLFVVKVIVFFQLLNLSFYLCLQNIVHLSLLQEMYNELWKKFHTVGFNFIC